MEGGRVGACEELGAVCDDGEEEETEEEEEGGG